MGIVIFDELSTVTALSGILTALIILVVFRPFSFLSSIKSQRGKYNFPPGPPNLWPIGSFPFVFFRSGFTNILTTSLKLGHTYGKIYSVHLGPYPAVIINDAKILKEAFNTMAASGRPHLEFSKAFHNNKMRGIIIQEGESWRELRRFTLRQLQNYGLGKDCIESMIVEEASYLIEALEALKNQPISTKNVFNVPIINILWQIISGERFKMNDPNVTTVINLLNTTAEFSAKLIVAIFFQKLARRIPKISGYDEIMGAFKANYNFGNNFIQDRIQQRKLKSQWRRTDFTDVFIQKIVDTTDPKSDFYGKLGEENLTAIIGDLFLGGTETSSTTLRWFLLFMAVNPKIQKELHDEIDYVLEGAFPRLTHRQRMLFTEACIIETLRMSTILPFGLFHSASEDTKIAGYDIPKDTMILGNNYAIHHDPDTWGEDAEVFKPERFLKLDAKPMKIIKHEAFVPFSVGRRVCPGEQLGKDQLFIFVTSIFQKFSVDWNRAKPKPRIDRVLTGAVIPLPHEVILTRRLVIPGRRVLRSRFSRSMDEVAAEMYHVNPIGSSVPPTIPQ